MDRSWNASMLKSSIPCNMCNAFIQVATQCCSSMLLVLTWQFHPVPHFYTALYKWVQFMFVLLQMAWHFEEKRLSNAFNVHKYQYQETLQTIQKHPLKLDTWSIWLFFPFKYTSPKTIVLGFLFSSLVKTSSKKHQHPATWHHKAKERATFLGDLMGWRDGLRFKYARNGTPKRKGPER